MSRLPTLRITDYALTACSAALGERSPEQGGALLGVRGADVVTTFVHDVDGWATGAVYQNSAELGRQISRIETETAARFKGIVHSHPRGMRSPSEQDCREYVRSLELNPAMSRYLAVIVTHDVLAPLEPHETGYGAARTSCFGITIHGGQAHLQPMRPVVVPVAASVRRAGLRFTEGEPVLVAIEGVPMICAQVDGAGFPDASLMFSTDFPAAPPVLIRYDEDVTPVPLPWDPRHPAADRLARALEEVRPRRSFSGADRSWLADQPIAPGLNAMIPTPMIPTPPTSRSAGHAGEPGQTDHGVATVVTPNQKPVNGGPDPSELFARTGGILSPTLRNRRVLVVGTGSVGGYVAELLARSGVGGFDLLDPDHVEPENLGRTPYLRADVGDFKVDALARRLAGVEPGISVTARRDTVDGCDRANLLDMVRSADLLVATTDDNGAQQRLNHLAYWAGTPALFIGLYRGAAGGEVILTSPGGPCWQCSTGGARVSGTPGVRRVTDYGTGRLVAEPGLVTDIQFVSAAGAKLGLALLQRDLPDGSLGRFLEEPHQASLTTVIFGMVPRYEYFPQVFRGAGGQYAFQSVWLSATPQPDCPVCGDLDQRSDPTMITPPPGTDRLLALLRQTGGPADGAGPADGGGCGEPGAARRGVRSEEAGVAEER